VAPSQLELQFSWLWVDRYPEIDLHSEHKFYEGRKFRFDFAHLPTKTAIEIDGGTWIKGRHNTGTGYAGDCEKLNLAALDRWVVFHLTGDMITNKWLDTIAESIRKAKAT